VRTRPLFIRTQYGDESIALVQWAYEAGLIGTVVYIDTGFASAAWEARIKRGEEHAIACGFKTLQIVSPITFADAVIGRGEFPSSKFQWCSALLKGLPFVDWLESVDPEGHGVILIAKRSAAALAHAELSEWIEPCQFHGDRTVWHPMIAVTDLERDALLSRAGFTPLQHRSLECEPCVNSTPEDVAKFNDLNCQKESGFIKDEASHDADRKRLYALEQELGSVWEWKPTVPVSQKYLDLFYRGCGNHFGCGL
jgi:hypothetical protein